MICPYRDGYWKAILDIYNALNDNNDSNIIRSKKAYKNFVTSMLDTLLKSPDFLDEWISYGGAMKHSDRYVCYVTKDGKFYTVER